MSDNMTLYCTFQSAGRLFGVPVLDVKEVTAETRFTRIPHAPEEVLGLVNIRGHIFLALNLATMLAAREHQLPPDAQFVIFKPGVGPAFGIIVDHIGDIISVADQETESVSSGDPQQTSFSDRSSLLSSVCKLDDKLLIILDPRKFLACVEQAMEGVAKFDSSLLSRKALAAGFIPVFPCTHPQLALYGAQNHYPRLAPCGSKIFFNISSCPM